MSDFHHVNIVGFAKVFLYSIIALSNNEGFFTAKGINRFVMLDTLELNNRIEIRKVKIEFLRLYASAAIEGFLSTIPNSVYPERFRNQTFSV